MISEQVYKALNKFKGAISNIQILCLKEGLKGEEAGYFQQLILELEQSISNCPVTYQTDGQGENAICSLKYFKGNSAAYIVEMDVYGPPHLQAYGVISLNGYYPELGYIDLSELIKVGFELDFHYTPITVADALKQ